MKPETILVVDDNQQMIQLLAGDLLPHLGYKVLVAHNCRAGLEMVKTRQPDLILLDLQLSDGDGLGLLRQLAAEEISIPTIIATAHGSEEVAVDAFRLGVHDYLIKPFDLGRLGSAITRALSETRLRRDKAELISQLKQQVSWLMILSKVGQSVTSILDLDQVLRRIVDAAVYLTRADEGFLALVDEQSDQLRLSAAKDLDRSRSTLLNLQLNDSTAGAAIRTGRPVRMHSTVHGRSFKISPGYLVHSLLHVPIFSQEKALGVLSVDNRTSQQAFTEMDETLLTSLAGYAAVAIENARLYKQAQWEIDERKRAEEQLAASLQEKVILLQEIHHRVKNNLQVITSLLNLQASSTKDSATLRMLQDSQARIRSMALIHEKLYRSTNLAEINLGEYIRELTAYLFQAHNAPAVRIRLQLPTDDLFLSVGTAVTCGLILNELISNIFKHAFPDGRKGELRIELHAGPDDHVSLVVADSGVGLPPELDLNTTNSLGFQLVTTLVTDQLRGTIEVQRRAGTEIRIKFRTGLQGPATTISEAPAAV